MPEEAGEDRVSCILAGQEGLLRTEGLDWPCKAGQGVNEPRWPKRWAKHSVGPSLICCSSPNRFPAPSPLWNGGSSSSLRTWFKCSASKRSTSATVAKEQSSPLHYSLSEYPAFSSPDWTPRVIRYLLVTVFPLDHTHHTGRDSVHQLHPLWCSWTSTMPRARGAQEIPVACKSDIWGKSHLANVFVGQLNQSSYFMYQGEKSIDSIGLAESWMSLRRKGFH